MSRVLVHRVSAMIVIVALTFVALPAADARPLVGTQATAGTATSWMAALSTWVSSFFLGTPARTATRTSAADLGGIIITSGPRMHPETGTCIDPNGHTVPCNPYPGT